MDPKIKTVTRWPLIVLSLAMVMLCGACGSRAATPTAAPVTPVPTATASLRLAGGAVEVQDEQKGWVPVGAETTFELIGELESTNPWMVTGNTFAVRDLTQIAEGLETGDLVRVKGVILEDATWLAEFIYPAEEKVDLGITLIGKVNSVEPWVVSGITLDVTDDTIVTGKIAPDMIARIEIFLLENGVWEVISVTPLSSFTKIPGCATVPATVARVNKDEVRFTGWPVLPLGKDLKVESEAGNPATLNVNRLVLVVICPTQNGQFTITKIVVLRDSSDDPAHVEKVLICHKPDKESRHTLSLPTAAVPAHLGHGDTRGPCP